MLRKKLPRNWRLEKTLLQRRKWSNSTKDEWIFYAAWSGVSNSEFIERSSTKIKRTIGFFFGRLKNLLWSWLTEQLWQYLRSSSSSYFFEFKKAQPRSWNAAKYTRDFEYSWKGFWLSTCPTSAWRITQWFKKFGNTNGNSENRRNWEKWKRRTIAINTFTLLFAREKV